jgi:hypothetical protein
MKIGVKKFILSFQAGNPNQASIPSASSAANPREPLVPRFSQVIVLADRLGDVAQFPGKTDSFCKICFHLYPTIQSVVKKLRFPFLGLLVGLFVVSGLRVVVFGWRFAVIVPRVRHRIPCILSSAFLRCVRCLSILPW